MFEVRRFFWNRLLKNSFSLDGEDLVIEKLCGNKKTGFYVDVGACSPTRLSNTKHFYDLGWSGINIEPNPSLIPCFEKSRSRDINLNCGIGTKNNETAEFYRMFPPTLSTFSKEFLAMNLGRGHQHVSTEKIPMYTLASVLEKYIPPNTEVDFLTIDAEGNDFDVLQSNDWARFRPRVVIVECITQYNPSPVQNDVFAHFQFMNSHGYDLAYHNGIDCFYVRRAPGV